MSCGFFGKGYEQEIHEENRLLYKMWGDAPSKIRCVLAVATLHENETDLAAEQDAGSLLSGGEWCAEVLSTLSERQLLSGEKRRLAGVG